jgi:hypothetical protein
MKGLAALKSETRRPKSEGNPKSEGLIKHRSKEAGVLRFEFCRRTSVSKEHWLNGFARARLIVRSRKDIG